MDRVKVPAMGIGAATLMVVGLACGDAESPAQAPQDTPVVGAPGVVSDGAPVESARPAEQAPGVSPASIAPMTSMIPRPGTAQELVARADVVVLGTIGSVLEEKMIGPYGDDGKPSPAGEGGIPVTDYLLRIESTLKADDAVAGLDTLVLRMYGHLGSQGSSITSVTSALPEPGNHLLLALGRNPDGTYGSGSDSPTPGVRYG